MINIKFRSKPQSALAPNFAVKIAKLQSAHSFNPEVLLHVPLPTFQLLPHQA